MENITSSIKKIAREALYLETLETRNSDDLDFHDLAIWQIRAALEAAYEAGKAAGYQECLDDERGVSGSHLG